MLTKSDFRKQFKKIRHEIGKDIKNNLDEKICKNLVDLKVFDNCDTVLLYAPLGDEINTEHIFLKAIELGKRVAFPRCEVLTKQMDFYFVDDLSQLKIGAYNIKEPDGSDIFTFDKNQKTLCIVPCLSCDKSFTRLGYGAGYYDRYFAKYPDISKAALCYEACITQNLVCDEHDIKMDFIVTENSIYGGNNE